MDDMDAQGWTDDAEQVWAEIRSWRSAHPTATWAEIQRAVDTGLQRLRERALTETAQASAVADFGGARERPACPGCGEPLHADGRKRRRLRIDQGGSVTLTRTHGWCPRCRAGLFPPG
jgi:ribosomal protein S27AE